MLLALWIAAVAGCGQDGPPRGPAASRGDAAPGSARADEVTLALNWYPEAEHGGYFAALVEGLYRQQGLDVRILPGGPSVPVLAEVARGRATFGIANADNLLFARAEDAPLVAVFAPLQTSPRCIMVHAQSGITRLAELRDVRLAVTPGAAFVQFLRKHAPLEGVQLVPYSGNVAQFLLHADYAQQGYVISEPFVARREGADPRTLLLAELGFNPYTSVLFTTDELVARRPELVQTMVAASRLGWERYLADPGPANAEILRMNPEMDRDVLQQGAAALAPLVAGEDPPAGIGAMSRARWQTLAEQLVEIELLEPARVAVDRVFTAAFLDPPPDTTPTSEAQPSP